MFVPCLAALSAVAVTEFLRRFRRGDTGNNKWENILLPLNLAVTAAAQIYILKAYAVQFSGVLVPLIAACVGAALLVMLAVKFLKKEIRVLTGAAAAVAVAGLLAAPAYWAYAPIQYGTNVITPFAGPPAVSKPDADPKTDISQDSWGKKWYAGAPLTGELVSTDLVKYLKAHDNGSRYLLAVPSIIFAAPLILDDNISVMPIGGFVGSDKSITPDGLRSSRKAAASSFYLFMPNGKNGARQLGHIPREADRPSVYSKNPRMEFYMLYDLSSLKK
jgi:4-amino-4-deoxy-L-arabinose transferase-like glycosyltransferase